MLSRVRYSSIFLVVWIFVLWLLTGCSPQESGQNQKLWFTYPAEYWNSQALHLGNGYFGVSFFGGIDVETFALSESSMWTGQPARGDWEPAGVNPRALNALPGIRRHIQAGEMHLADSLISADFFGSSAFYGHFTSIGDLLIRFSESESGVDGYHRELDLACSIGRVKYEQNGVQYNREYFCSYPDRVMGMRFDADHPASISFRLGMSVVQDSSVICINGNRIALYGWINGNNRPFVVHMEVLPEGGKLTSKNGELVVQNADRVDLYLTIATNYRMEYPDYLGEDPVSTTDTVLTRAVSIGYDQLKQRHIDDYQTLYNRVSFQLEEEEDMEQFSTSERFQRLKAGKVDPGYAELAFNLGRYMIISASRPGTLPANLQGVWNAFRVAPWAGNYQSNINLQEIYWSCGPTDLAECQQAYIDWIEDLSRSGEEIARRIYGTGGWVSHTTGNIWGHAAPIGNHPWGMYPMGAAWHCQHVWDQYAFTGDLDYLSDQAYPLLKGASQFWMENLVPFQGFLITAPSVSAEHGALVTSQGLDPAYHDFRSDRYVYSIPGIYQDMEMIWDLFSNTAEAARIMGDTVFAENLIQTREKLLPLQIGKHGQLQEWYIDIDSPECHHRHISHLYALCPGRQIHPSATPELAEAARVALNMRGDGRFMDQELAAGGNWARAHRMWCWTRLGDGDRALQIMKEMLTEQGFENGLTYQHASYHWEREDLYKEGDLYCHFQLDGSASVPGCIAEMLVQSHMGEIQLLPALPEEWPCGHVTGLKARGGYRIDLRWEKGDLVEASLTASAESIPVIRVKDQVVDPLNDPRIIIHSISGN